MILIFLVMSIFDQDAVTCLAQREQPRRAFKFAQWGCRGAQTEKGEVQELALRCIVRELIDFVIILDDMLREEECKLLVKARTLAILKDCIEAVLERDWLALRVDEELLE